jgi:hypothetical protein
MARLHSDDPAQQCDGHPPEPIRLLDILGALSVVTDLAHGRLPEQALRAAALAVRLADRISEASVIRRDALYVTVLRSLGCTATSHEYAHWFGGDDIDVRRQGDVVDGHG